MIMNHEHLKAFFMLLEASLPACRKTGSYSLISYYGDIRVTVETTYTKYGEVVTIDEKEFRTKASNPVDFASAVKKKVEKLLTTKHL